MRTVCEGWVQYKGGTKGEMVADAESGWYL